MDARAGEALAGETDGVEPGEAVPAQDDPASGAAEGGPAALLLVVAVVAAAAAAEAVELDLRNLDVGGSIDPSCSSCAASSLPASGTAVPGECVPLPAVLGRL